VRGIDTATIYSPTRRRVWDLMLDSDMNSRYWGYLARRYGTWDQWIRVGLAIAGTGTVVSFISKYPSVGAFLSLLTAGVFAAMFQLNYPVKVERMATLSGRWTEIQFELENLWLRIDGEQDDVARSVLTALESKVVQVKKDEVQFSYDQKLLERCWKEVLSSRGLPTWQEQEVA
jgi:hypothetical protein